MQKFTVFTVILSVVVIISVADLVVNNYLPGLDNTDIPSEIANGNFPLPDSIDTSKAMQTNVLGSDSVGTAADAVTAPAQPNRLGFDLGSETSVILPSVTDATVTALPDAETATPVARTETPISEDTFDLKPAGPSTVTSVEPDSTSASTSSASTDFEDSNFVAFSKNAVLRDEQIKSAGFVGAYLEDEDYDGSLYKTIYTSDLYDVTVKKTVIRTKDVLLAKVYVVKMGPNSNVDDVYKVLKVRGSEGLDTEVNETNTFGAASFYMNDNRRQNTAFLTVKIGNSIYGFSYPKEYHLQATNLIKLLEWEVK